MGWTLSDRLEQGLTLATVERALFERRPRDGLLHHTDRGSQYTAQDYRGLLEKAGIEVSMSGKGDCWDNAPIESFFATLKSELVSHVEYQTREQARRALFDFMGTMTECPDIEDLVALARGTLWPNSAPCFFTKSAQLLSGLNRSVRSSMTSEHALQVSRSVRLLFQRERITRRPTRFLRCIIPVTSKPRGLHSSLVRIRRDS